MVHDNGDVREQKLDEVATAYLDTVETGQAPDRQEWLARHDDLASELGEFFADLDAVRSWTAPLRLVKAGRFGDYELLAELGRGGMGSCTRPARSASTGSSLSR